MKIWLFRRRYSEAGGAERFTLRLAHALTHHGHHVLIVAEQWPEDPKGNYETILLPSENSATYAQLCQDRILNHETGFFFSLERLPQQRLFRAGDGVHASWLERRAPFQSALARWWTPLNAKHRHMLKLEKRVFHPDNTHTILSNSKMVREEILHRFSFPEKRITVIHPGVDLNEFSPCSDSHHRQSLRKRFGIPEDAVVWCFVGSGFERKGLRWALEAAAYYRKSNVWLLALGRGSYRFYHAYSEKLGLRNQFVTLSPEEALAKDVYHASDAMILPTIYDPCANACLEAAACGLPVMTTRSNGAHEYVPGLFIDQPDRVQEWAPHAEPFTRPLSLRSDLEATRAILDEKKCWDKTIQLITEIGCDESPAFPLQDL